MKWTWRYADWIIVIIAVAVGFAVWFVPNGKANADFQRLKVVQAERRAELLKQMQQEADEAAHAKMVEEEGIVYVPTPTPKPAVAPAPAPVAAPEKTPAKPKGK